MYSSIHFPAESEPDKKRKVLRLRVDSADEVTKEAASALSSVELRALLGVNSYANLKSEAASKRRSINSHALFLIEQSLKATITSTSDLFQARAGTYSGGRGDFFHDLFPFLEAFSPSFVNSLLDEYQPHASSLIDPFSGSGTAPLTFARRVGRSGRSFACEINPLLQRVFSIKREFLRSGKKSRQQLSYKASDYAMRLDAEICGVTPAKDLALTYSSVFGKSQMFSDRALDQALRLRTLQDQLDVTEPNLSCLLEMAILSSLIPASEMQRAGDLRRKTLKERLRNSDDLVSHTKNALLNIASRIAEFEKCDFDTNLILADARQLTDIPSLSVDALITSPPYLNGTNYFRNTKIELWFLRVLRKRTDIGKYRDKAIAAGINDIRGVRGATLPNESSFDSISACLKALDECAYDRRIPKMVRWYASDINNAINASLRHVSAGGLVAVDIGDSIYSGVRVPTDELIAEILENNGCPVEQTLLIRRRLSRGGKQVKQVCLVASKNVAGRPSKRHIRKRPAQKRLPALQERLTNLHPDFKKRNWGHAWHSLCSYQGKMKPAIAHLLVDTFVPENGLILDPFSGVGTIPFEAALSGRQAFGFDLSPAAIAISKAKLTAPYSKDIQEGLNELSEFIGLAHKSSLDQGWLPSFNRSLTEYYHPRTLSEILKAREWFQSKQPVSGSTAFIMACLLHVLHGNRPYALSRRSHPITPFAPQGEVEYKSLMASLQAKVERALSVDLPDCYVDGEIFEADATKQWPADVNNIDAIITSPPFFSSTKFYLANWIRLWFSGWSKFDFEAGRKMFLETRQMQGFECYDPILRQARERLKSGGTLLLHLGKSARVDMAAEISKRAKTWFSNIETWDESVIHLERHGITDKGGTTDHQYLLAY